LIGIVTASPKNAASFLADNFVAIVETATENIFADPVNEMAVVVQQARDDQVRIRTRLLRQQRRLNRMLELIYPLSAIGTAALVEVGRKDFIDARHIALPLFFRRCRVRPGGASCALDCIAPAN
jgi:hypothetical protein